ncbi:MAG TPA: type II secretion system F family protein [Acidimicrobiia bacterium]|jgi:tight adherence protein B
MSLLAAVAIGWTCAAIAALAVGARLPLPRVRPARPTRGGIDGARTWLQQAGLGVAPLQFAGASALLGLIALAVGGALVGPAIALVPAGGAACVPTLYYGRRRALRLAAIQRAWPDALRDLVAAVAAGLSIHQGLVELADRGPEPVRDALARYPSLSRAVGTPSALEIARAELADPVSDRVMEVLVLAVERGGAIVRTILEELAVAIAADVKLLEALDTEVLESRINARAVVALPWFVLLVLNLSHGPFRAFYQTPTGLVVVLVGGLLTILGSAWIARLGRLPAEPRVFAGSEA